jgi:integrase
MKDQVHAYIESKKLAWEATTIKSETARLIANLEGLEMGPDAYYAKLIQTKKPYTIKTTFIRIASFEKWLNGQSAYQDFIDKNRKLFRNAYEKEKLEVTFEEALERIKKIDDKELREKALQLIGSGARWKESTTLDGSGFVIAKGGRRRKLLNADSVRFEKSYSHFLRRLKDETGLKPHSLRKLFATKLVDSGFTIQDLMMVMGWSSLQTAMSYLQTKKESELEKRIEKLVS